MRTSISRPPTASLLAVHAKSWPLTHTSEAPARVAASRSRATRVGSVSPMTTRLPSLKMPDLSRPMSSSVGPRTSVWSKLILVSTATLPSTTLVLSHWPPNPTSITATSTASSANQASAAAVRSSKRVGASSMSCSSRASDSRISTKAPSSIGSPLRADPLVDPDQVGTGVRAHGQPLGGEECGGHGRGRSLAVGSGDVQRRIGALGIPEQAGQRSHPLQGGP